MKRFFARLFKSKNEDTNSTKVGGGGGGGGSGGNGSGSMAAPEEAVMQKLKKSNKQAGAMPGDELLEWARSLCIKDDLVEWYLNPEFASTVEAVCCEPFFFLLSKNSLFYCLYFRLKAF